MISTMMIDSLIRIAASGGSLKVDGSKYMSDSLKRVAASLHPGAHLEICNSEKMMVDTCLRIAAATSAGKVIFS